MASMPALAASRLVIDLPIQPLLLNIDLRCWHRFFSVTLVDELSLFASGLAAAPQHRARLCSRSRVEHAFPRLFRAVTRV